MKKQKKKHKKRHRQVNQIIADLDPSENYKGTEYEGLDAFERQLKRFDIKHTDDYHSVSKFF